MSAADSEYRDLVVDLSKELIASTEPDEVDMFDDLAVEYFQDPTPPDISASGSDDALGFGLNELMVAASPAALAMVSVVMNYVVKVALDTFKDEGTALIKQKVKEWFQTRTEKSQPSSQPASRLILPGSPESKEVYELAVREAKRFGMSDQKAVQMADDLLRSRL